MSDEKLVIAAEDGAVLSVEIASTGTVMMSAMQEYVSFVGEPR